MAHQPTCLIASDEEDEDGNLCETATPGTSGSVPETSTDMQKEQPAPKIKVKNLDSLKVQSLDLKKSASDLTLSEKSKNTKNLSENATNKDTVRKHTKSDPNISYNTAKYARQATPICDAIMREYSKRQRIMKLKGKTGSVEISDLPIQDLLKKAKENASKKKSNIVAPSTNENKEKTNTNTVRQISTKEKTSDPLSVVKEEIIDVKPEPIDDSVNPEIKEEDDSNLSDISIKSNQSDISIKTNQTDISIKTNQTLSRGHGRSRGRGKLSNRGGNQRKRKWDTSDDDDTDDPDFDPLTVVKSKRTTRSSTKPRLNHALQTELDTFNNEEDSSQYQTEQSSHSLDSNDSHSQDKDISNYHVPASIQNDKSQENMSIAKVKVLDVAVKLKSLAEKIANVLTKDPSPNINCETEKLLQTTQELIEIQKKTLQNSGEGSDLPSSAIKIKQEVIDTNEHVKIPHGLAESCINQTPVQSPTLTKKSIQDQLNQLQRHEAALKKKLSETAITKNNVSNTLNSILSPNSPNAENSGPVTIQEKCTFVLDYFTSYQDVFDKTTVQFAIPTLSESIMPCVDALTECIQRINRAGSIKSKDLKQEEINLAKQAYVKTVTSASEKFLPLFTSVMTKIIQAKTSKALTNTLILFIAGFLHMKTSKLENHTNRLRRILLFMTRLHQKHWLPVDQMLMSSNDEFDNDTKFIRQMLKYFHARRFMEIPAELLCTYPDVSEEEETQYQTELSVMDSAILMKINPAKSKGVIPVENTENLDSCKLLRTLSSSNLGEKNQSTLCNITAEFEDAMQRIKDGNTKRAEQRLDPISNEISVGGFGNNGIMSQSNVENTQAKLKKPKGMDDIKNFHVTVNLGKRVSNISTVKLNSTHEIDAGLSICPEPSTSNQHGDKGMLLAQLLENDHVGLDSLFSSYLKLRNEGSSVTVKSEPLDVPENYQEPTDPLSFVSLKEEPTEQPLLDDAIFNESFSEEFTKTEQDFKDADFIS